MIVVAKTTHLKHAHFCNFENTFDENQFMIQFKNSSRLTCSPAPEYMHPTILSSNVMSNFWSKSSSFDACSARVAITRLCVTVLQKKKIHIVTRSKVRLA